MRCEEAQNQLNARVDGELRAEDTAVLDAHLADCSECRAAGEAYSIIDSDLRSAFVPRRDAAAHLVESTIAALRTSAIAPTVAPQAEIEPRVNWAQVLLSLAAGFLLAVAPFRPWESKGEPPDLLTAPPRAGFAPAAGAGANPTAARRP